MSAAVVRAKLDDWTRHLIGTASHGRVTELETLLKKPPAGWNINALVPWPQTDAAPCLMHVLRQGTRQVMAREPGSEPEQQLLAVLELLLAAKANVNEPNEGNYVVLVPRTALYYCGTAAVFRRLVEAKADARVGGSSGYTPLMHCVSMGHGQTQYQLVEAMLAHDAADCNRVDFSGRTPWERARKYDHLQLLPLLARAWRAQLHQCLSAHLTRDPASVVTGYIVPVEQQ